MKVYKYRGASGLQRTLDTLVQNAFFAPTANKLNDPVEVVLNDKLVSSLAKLLGPLLDGALEQLTTMRHTVGIYSLSRTVTDELMWAHYGESHKGFCIEYDLDRLLVEAGTQWQTLDVCYSERPPSLTMNDLFGNDEAKAATAKMVGYKSRRWDYEKELRIITTQAGLNFHAEAAVTGIYFGCRCTPDVQAQIRSALRNRTHRYAALRYPEYSYQLEFEHLERIEIDGTAPEHLAPVAEGAIATPEEMGIHADRHATLLRAVEIVRRDPACAKVTLADITVNPAMGTKIFVQYETTVKTTAYHIVKRYFEDTEL